MERRIRPAGVEYRRIIEEWNGVPAESGAECMSGSPGV
jgi:hypothetical protein